ncbi:MAG: HD domain-containing protein [Candidatus Coatesbacteria bacterium]|nr:HD domain-containing protein [Candidatus Coatesbacteria bacterium]
MRRDDFLDGVASFIREALPEAVSRGFEGLRTAEGIKDYLANSFTDRERLKARVERLSELIEIGYMLSGEVRLKELLLLILDRSRNLMNADRSTIYLVDEERQKLRSMIATELEITEIEIPIDAGIAGACAMSGKLINIPEPYSDPRFDKDIDKKTGYVTKNMLTAPLWDKRRNVIGVMQVLNKFEGPFDDEDERLIRLLGSFAAVSLENAMLYEAQEKMLEKFFESLATAIDAKDPYTAGHSARVTDISVGIAQEMGVESDALRELRFAGLLHDIGKIGVRDNVLGKPGRLSDDERAHVQEHAQRTFEILRRIPFTETLKRIPDIAAHHHEKVSGKGYPDGLKWFDVPLGSRIICVADVFDAVTSHRPYRAPMPFDNALALIEGGSGDEFDPQVVEAFKRYALRELKGRMDEPK